MAKCNQLTSLPFKGLIRFKRSGTRHSSGDEILEHDIGMRYSFRQVHYRSILLPLLRLMPPTEGFPMTISVIICTEVKGWPGYTAVKKLLLPKVSTPWVTYMYILLAAKIEENVDKIKHVKRRFYEKNKET